MVRLSAGCADGMRASTQQPTQTAAGAAAAARAKDVGEGKGAEDCAKARKQQRETNGLATQIRAQDAIKARQRQEVLGGTVYMFPTRREDCSNNDGQSMTKKTSEADMITARGEEVVCPTAAQELGTPQPHHYTDLYCGCSTQTWSPMQRHQETTAYLFSFWLKISYHDTESGPMSTQSNI